MLSLSCEPLLDPTGNWPCQASHQVTRKSPRKPQGVEPFPPRAKKRELQRSSNEGKESTPVLLSASQVRTLEFYHLSLRRPLLSHSGNKRSPGCLGSVTHADKSLALLTSHLWSCFCVFAWMRCSIH